jgi:2-polyprenyl-6-methoxyphenol hydroxylase-like FAD-dependent oxidoreductase
MTSAVVLGGGFAGVLAARVLAGHVDEVTLVEAGRYPARPGARVGLPQAHHSHILVTGGAQALETLLPGTIADLLAAGAHRCGLTGNALIRSAAGWMRRHETGAYVISASRWLTDHVVRRRALDGPAVTVREQTHARALTGDADRVTGVAVAGPDFSGTIPADLVVDATGRRSRAPRWLADLGGPEVGEDTVDSGLAYARRIYRAPAGLGADLPAIMLHPRTRNGREGHGATLFPIEGNRWIVTLTGTRGNEPPITAEGFTACVAALGSPVLTDLVAAAEPLGAVRPYRVTANRRRYFERRPGTAGLVVLGDALAATNPVYSHGMSVAALGALRLDRELAQLGVDPWLCPDLQRAVAAEADQTWRAATAADSSGGRERALPAPLRARQNHPDLLREMFRAQTLTAPPDTTGDTVRRALAADPPPSLSTDDAIAQYPALSGWWRPELVGGRHER